LVVENYPVDEALREAGGPLVVADVQASEQTNYPLTVTVQPGREMTLRLSHATERFDAATIARMAGHYETLLEGIAVDAGQPVGDLPILPDTERRLVLEAWNDTAYAYPEDRTIHEIFAAQAARTPDAVAIVFEGQELRYRELNERANRLAHALRRR